MTFNKSLSLLALLLLTAFPSFAQTAANPLRDSLSMVSEQLYLHPDSLDLRLRKAALNLELGQWQYAKDEYDLVLAQDAKNLAALYFRAYANTRLARYNFARLDYEAVLSQVPGHFEASLGLALLNQRDRHFTEALDGINLLVTAHPDSAVAWIVRSGIEEEQGMLELAEYDCTEALRLEPTNRDYLLRRADLRIRLGRYDQARKDLDEIVRLGTPKAALKEWYSQLL